MLAESENNYVSRAFMNGIFISQKPMTSKLKILLESKEIEMLVSMNVYSLQHPNYPT